ncbi:MAG: tRNA-dihydrouridine synthase family protein [Thermodesulfobacteriota bacterium]
MPSLCLAPLRGLTDATFRTTFADNFPGFSDSIAPFLTTFQGTKVKAAKLADLLPENNPSLPVIPQIIGKDSKQFIVLATMLRDLGYETVNLNLGCPYPMVANKGRGSGFLPFPDKLERFLDEIMAAPTRLSIKTRLGRRDAAEIIQLMPIFNRFPLSELIIHPRLGVQMYKGQVDLESFGQCLALSKNPVVYNGDIINLDSFSRLQQRFPEVNRWMIGRGALANPFLPGQICQETPPLPPEPFVQLSLFHDQLFDLYGQRMQGPGHLLGRMKGLWFYLSQPLAGGAKILKKIQKCKKIAEYQRLMAKLMAEPPAWQGLLGPGQ